MIWRPSFAAPAAGLAALSVVAALEITPIFTHPDRPPGAAIRFWWARIAPLGYADHALRDARGVFIADTHFVCPSPESEALAWRTIAAQPGADSMFRKLFAAPGSATRLYALLGLAHARSATFPQALQLAARDSSPTRILVWIPQPGTSLRPLVIRDTTLPLSELAKASQLRSWQEILSQAPAAKCAA